MHYEEFAFYSLEDLIFHGGLQFSAAFFHNNEEVDVYGKCIFRR